MKKILLMTGCGLLVGLLQSVAWAQDSTGPSEVQLPAENQWPVETTPTEAVPSAAPSSEVVPSPYGSPETSSTTPVTDPAVAPMPAPVPDAPVVTAPPSEMGPMPGATVQAEPAPYGPDPAVQPALMEEPDDEVEQRENEEVFGFFTVVPEVGFLYFDDAKLTLNGFTSTVDARKGFVAKVHLDVGGDGLAMELAPFFAIEMGGIEPISNTGPVDLSKGFSSGSFQAIGGELTFVYRANLKRFFPSIGIGVHADVLLGDQIQYGMELMGRIPIGFSLYLGKSVALVAEAGLMMGVTGIRTDFQVPDQLAPLFDELDPAVVAELNGATTPQDYQDWLTNHSAEVTQVIESNPDLIANLPQDYQNVTPEQLKNDFIQQQLASTLRFGFGFGIDIMVGIRFP